MKNFNQVQNPNNFQMNKNNQKVIINSFSGNSADLLRNKVSFVTGIMNYLYPKIVLNKMEFLKKKSNLKFFTNKPHYY